jgi:hypothetical protein
VQRLSPCSFKDASDDARVGALGVPDLPSFVDLLVRQPDVFGGQQNLPVRKVYGLVLSGDFALLLCRIHRQAAYSAA